MNMDTKKIAELLNSPAAANWDSDGAAAVPKPAAPAATPPAPSRPFTQSEKEQLILLLLLMRQREEGR